MTKVALWVHTTSGVEFEIREAKTQRVLYDRWYVCEDGEDEIEESEKANVYSRAKELGLEIVEEVWS